MFRPRSVDTGPVGRLWSGPLGGTAGEVAPMSPQIRTKTRVMKVVNSLRSAKKRDKNCRIVRRRGRVYVINKSNPRYKARQG